MAKLEFRNKMSIHKRKKLHSKTTTLWFGWKVLRGFPT